jgi:hypothetical protein
MPSALCPHTSNILYVGRLFLERSPLCPESGHLRSWLDCPLRVKSGHSIDEPLFSDQRPTRFGVEVVEELVATGGQGPEADYAFAISRHNFFNP